MSKMKKRESRADTKEREKNESERKGEKQRKEVMEREGRRCRSYELITRAFYKLERVMTNICLRTFFPAPFLLLVYDISRTIER